MAPSFLKLLFGTIDTFDVTTSLPIFATGSFWRPAQRHRPLELDLDVRKRPFWRRVGLAVAFTTLGSWR